MLRLSQFLFHPPKTPRNVFFPWQTFTLVKSGTYLEPNRVAFRVPPNFTKPEIRNYLRKLYGIKVIKVNTYVRVPKIVKGPTGKLYQNGPTIKKAIVTCEETIPDHVKMMSSTRYLDQNPIITKGQNLIRNWPDKLRPGVSRQSDWFPRHSYAWMEPIPSFLAGKEGGPPLEKPTFPLDLTKPHEHFSNDRFMLPGVPKQVFPTPDYAGIRAKRNATVKNLRGESFIHLPTPDATND